MDKTLVAKQRTRLRLSQSWGFPPHPQICFSRWQGPVLPTRLNFSRRNICTFIRIGDLTHLECSDLVSEYSETAQQTHLVATSHLRCLLELSHQLLQKKGEQGTEIRCCSHTFCFSFWFCSVLPLLHLLRAPAPPAAFGRVFPAR